MGVWEFVVVYLAAFVLVQLVVYRYLRGRSGEEAQVAFAGPPNADRGVGDDRDGRDPHEAATRRESRSRTDDRGAVRRCPSCGTTNDPDGPYTFCRNCASRLPG